MEETGIGSSPVELTSLWGVEIEGDHDDLRNMEQKLNGTVESLNSMFVARLDDLYVLRTRLWDRASTPEEATRLAVEDLKLVRSCLCVLDGCGPLNVGTVFRWDVKTGRIAQSRDSEFTIRIKKREVNWASPIQFSKLLKSAQSHIHIQDALREHTGGGDWYEIYKVLEALKHYYGTEQRLFDAFPSEQKQTALLKRTANSHRHTSRTYRQVKSPMPLPDARRLVAKLLEVTALAAPNQIVVPEALPPGTSINLKHYERGGEEKFGLKKLQLSASSEQGEESWHLDDPSRV